MAKASRSSVPSSNSVLEDLRGLQSRVEERIRELEPYASELEELRATAQRLGLDLSSGGGRSRVGRTAGVGKGEPERDVRKRVAKAAPRRRRNATGESRAEQVARLVEQQPGITVRALGEAMKVDSTGLYRVIRQLEGEGRVRKDGRQLQPVSAETRSDSDD